MCVRPKAPYRLHSGVPSQSDTNSKQRTYLKPVVSGVKLKVRGRVVEEGWRQEKARRSTRGSLSACSKKELVSVPEQVEDQWCV